MRSPVLEGTIQLFNMDFMLGFKECTFHMEKGKKYDPWLLIDTIID